MAVNLVNLESVSVVRGSVPVLDAVSLGVAAGERIGVVGRNGSGKTTLLRLLTREQPPDEGRITHVGGLSLARLDQATELPAEVSVRAAVVGSAAVHEWAGDARVRDVLDGLGLPGLGLDTPVGPLSGGERRRVALAAALVAPTDLLVLDEPTNHLDVEAVDWLAGHLAQRRGALVTVTHDRWFLDAVSTRTLEVADGTVTAYDGGYAAYVLARAERARQAAAADSRRQNLLRKELAWLRRGAPARTSKPRFRLDAAAALIADEPPPRDEVALQSFASARLGRQVYDVEDATVTMGDRLLLDRVTVRFAPGERVGVVGVNGAGKTTLLRLLTGSVHPTTGRVLVGRTVRPAYLAQEPPAVDPDLRVLAAVESVALRVTVGDRELTASGLLERFGFAARDTWKRVGELSGGERRRLQLLRLLMTEPNVLLLDEPTNDLDVDTLTALEDLLDGWPGTLIVVSHDRYFLERVTTRTLALLGDGAVRELPGGVEEFLARRRALLARAPAATVAGRTTEAAPRPADGVSAGDLRAARKELARVERTLARLDAREADLHAALAREASDYPRVLTLDAELTEVVADRAAAEDRWLELSQLLE